MPGSWIGAPPPGYVPVGLTCAMNDNVLKCVVMDEHMSEPLSMCGAAVSARDDPGVDGHVIAGVYNGNYTCGRSFTNLSLVLRAQNSENGGAGDTVVGTFMFNVTHQTSPDQIDDALPIVSAALPSSNPTMEHFILSSAPREGTVRLILTVQCPHGEKINTMRVLTRVFPALAPGEHDYINISGLVGEVVTTKRGRRLGTCTSGWVTVLCATLNWIRPTRS